MSGKEYKIGDTVYYTIRMTHTYDVRGPVQVREVREWNGKQQIRTSDDQASWLFSHDAYSDETEALRAANMKGLTMRAKR